MSGLFDPRNKLSAVLEFRDSMKEQYKGLKFTEFAYLKSEQTGERISPQSVRLSTVDKSSIVVQFGHGLLANGVCYRLEIDSYKVGLAKNQTISNNNQNNNRICITKC